MHSLLIGDGIICRLIRMLCTVKSPVKAEALTVNAFVFTGLFFVYCLNLRIRTTAAIAGLTPMRAGRCAELAAV